MGPLYQCRLKFLLFHSIYIFKSIIDLGMRISYVQFEQEQGNKEIEEEEDPCIGSHQQTLQV